MESTDYKISFERLAEMVTVLVEIALPETDDDLEVLEEAEEFIAAINASELIEWDPLDQ